MGADKGESLWLSIGRKREVTRGIGVRIVPIGRHQIMMLAIPSQPQVNSTINAKPKRKKEIVKNN
jgi:hypothetical protein